MDDSAVQPTSLTQIEAWEGGERTTSPAARISPTLHWVGSQGAAPIRVEIFDENPGFEL